MYELVTGARRHRGSKLAKRETIPATVRELTDAQALELQDIENVQRVDVHPLDEEASPAHERVRFEQLAHARRKRRVHSELLSPADRFCVITSDAIPVDFIGYPLFPSLIFLGTASGQFLRPAASQLLLSRFLPNM